jgi:hypothetical protein
MEGVCELSWAARSDRMGFVMGLGLVMGWIGMGEGEGILVRYWLRYWLRE